MYLVQGFFMLFLGEKMINLIKTIVYIALAMLFFMFVNNMWEDSSKKMSQEVVVAQ